MDIKIGFVESPRELVISSNDSADEVANKARTAITHPGGLLELTDNQGHRFFISHSQIAYVEIGAAEPRRVGFAGS